MDWESTYVDILAEFGWDPAPDREAALRLRDLVPKGTWRHVGTELKHRARATVVGCGPALESLQATDIPPGVVIAADGATKRLQEIGVVPRVVVTDLDGDLQAIKWAADQGSSIVVHAHGDNIDALPQVTGLGPLVAGTCQCDATGLAPLRNPAGFTDGDRAVRICEMFHVREIHLVAFDFDARPSSYSGRFDPDIKARKLAWARRIIEDVGQRIPVMLH